jgi:hypothetical protein
MQNGPKTIMSVHQPRPASFAARSKRPEPKGFQNAQRNYERYLALARVEALNGDTVGAETCYQHAEHYFRSRSFNGRKFEDKGEILEITPRKSLK